MVDLYERTEGLDPVTALQSASSGDDIDVQLLAADVEALQGNWSACFTRLIDAFGYPRVMIASVPGRIVELFSVAGDVQPWRLHERLLPALFSERPGCLVIGELVRRWCVRPVRGKSRSE